ncbi:hypothetical protein KFK09_019443 [Dendrobium nobile]|uniref:Uncharacterized protein n=1 Tax=Dendrobium nobile TaxID=94219 RepID=A0A8T3ARA3_DENNO|nr:hypothetical protein KFK09_019442 [Dendrobium nobile]KAI0498555.1 hypothetical protein KFK09_019443 [Dendrobium nobile]
MTCIPALTRRVQEFLRKIWLKSRRGTVASAPFTSFLRKSCDDGFDRLPFSSIRGRRALLLSRTPPDLLLFHARLLIRSSPDLPLCSRSSSHTRPPSYSGDPPPTTSLPVRSEQATGARYSPLYALLWPNQRVRG